MKKRVEKEGDEMEEESLNEEEEEEEDDEERGEMEEEYDLDLRVEAVEIPLETVPSVSLCDPSNPCQTIPTKKVNLTRLGMWLMNCMRCN